MSPSSPEFDQLDLLVRRIDALPPSTFDAIMYTDDDDRKWIQARMIMSGGLQASEQVKELMTELVRLVQRLFVTEKSRFENFTWSLYMNGYRELTAGRDLKDKQHHALYTPYNKWYVSFG